MYNARAGGGGKQDRRNRGRPGRRHVYYAPRAARAMARILTHDRFQKGEDVIASSYPNAREAIKGITRDLFH